jgi:hypothetical protein
MRSPTDQTRNPKPEETEQRHHPQNTKPARIGETMPTRGRPGMAHLRFPVSTRSYEIAAHLPPSTALDFSLLQ